MDDATQSQRGEEDLVNNEVGAVHFHKGDPTGAGKRGETKTGFKGDGAGIDPSVRHGRA